MTTLHIQPSTLQGQLHAPPSKSHTLRAILFATLAQGTSTIAHPLRSPDTDAMIQACQQLGARITVNDDHLTIQGTGGQLHTPTDNIDAGNSGQVLRYIAAVCALLSESVYITGDDSICHNRPIKPYIDRFKQLGARCESVQHNDHAPIIVQGPFKAGTIELNGEDSQLVTGLLIAASQIEGTTTINVTQPGETPWIDLTLSWLDRLTIPYTQQGYQQYQITGPVTITAFDYDVPGDWSSIAFPVVASLITQSPISISHCDLNDAQGDKAILTILQDMGANIAHDATNNTLQVKHSPTLSGGTWDVNHCIDAITILAVAACYANSPTTFTGAAIARHKESDRIQCIHDELSKMGANITTTDDGLIIHPAPLVGTTVRSHHDHRIAMSCAVAALGASGTTLITDTDCIAKSYVDFTAHCQQLGANIELAP